MVPYCLGDEVSYCAWRPAGTSRFLFVLDTPYGIQLGRIVIVHLEQVKNVIGGVFECCSIYGSFPKDLRAFRVEEQPASFVYLCLFRHFGRIRHPVDFVISNNHGLWPARAGCLLFLSRKDFEKLDTADIVRREHNAEAIPESFLVFIGIPPNLKVLRGLKYFT